MTFSKAGKWACVIVTLVQLVSCGGGGSGSDNDSDSGEGEILTGQFVDSPVCGLTYHTETIESVTDENGNFQYRAGETVVFGLGDLEFPAVTAAQIITPLELAGVEDLSDTAVINMARLLQTLDSDCDADNGIIISGQVLLATAEMSINFESESFDEDVQGLIATESSTYSTCEALVDAESAIAHLEETLNDLNNQESPPIGGGLEGKLGIWEGEGQQEGISWTIKITLTEDEQLIEYPSIDCEGILTLLEETEAQLLFWEDIIHEETSCCLDGFVELTDQDTNSLIYKWYFHDKDGEKGNLGAIGTVTKSD